MKSFYCTGSAGSGNALTSNSLCSHDVGSLTNTRARVAVYDAALAAPRVEEVAPAAAGDFIEALSSRVYDLARSQGGSIPYTVVREVAENLIHAAFAEPVISVLDGGNTIRFADQGPGIPDKDRALLPGFTSATAAMKRHIRGVGSGLPIVQDYLSASGGTLVIEDNLGTGAVVTIATKRSCAVSADTPTDVALNAPGPHFDTPAADFGSRDTSFSSPPPVLTNRQKQVLALVMESGSAGPSIVSRELGVGISTAYRDLASLEELGLIRAEDGKRTLTIQGMSYLDELIARSGPEPH